MAPFPLQQLKTQKYIQLQKHLFFSQSLNSSLGFHYFYRELYFLHACEQHHLQNNCPHKLITLMSGKEKKHMEHSEQESPFTQRSILLLNLFSLLMSRVLNTEGYVILSFLTVVNKSVRTILKYLLPKILITDKFLSKYT